MIKQCILMAILSLACFPAFGREGVTVRGGGDDTALEFTNAFHAAMNEIEKSFPELAAAIAPAGPAALLPKVNIFVEENPLLVPAGEGSQESVAVNEPATLNVWINRARWRNVGHTRIREAIALHEILSLAGAEGTGRYPISAAYLAKFNLRNDAFVFVAGRDPSLPDWKRRRTSCERVSVYDSTVSGNAQKSTEFFLVADASWKVLEKTYSLSYEFGAEEQGKFTSARSFSRSVDSDLGARGPGRLYQSAGNSIMRRDGRYVDHVKPATFHYVEKTADGRQGNYEWDARRETKKDLVQATGTEELADGSTRTVSEIMHEIRVPPITLRSQSTTCVAKNLGGEEWIALAGEPSLGIDVEKLNARAVLVNEADRAYRACTAENCAGRKAALKEEAQKFEATWNKIFLDRKTKLKARTYTQKDAEDALRMAQPKAAPKAKAAAPAAPKAAQPAPRVVNKPTWIKPRRAGESPILRMPGQSLQPSSAELGAIRALSRASRPKSGAQKRLTPPAIGEPCSKSRRASSMEALCTNPLPTRP